MLIYQRVCIFACWIAHWLPDGTPVGVQQNNAHAKVNFQSSMAIQSSMAFQGARLKFQDIGDIPSGNLT